MDKSDPSEAEKDVKNVTSSFEAMDVDANSESASSSKPESTSVEFMSTYYPNLGRYLHPLTLFIVYPTIQIDRGGLEIIVLSRILLYRALERMNKKLYVKPFSRDWLSQLQLELINLGRPSKSRLLDQAIDRVCVLLQPENQSLTNLKQSVWDESCSHFILRVIYCRKDDLKEYFIARELEWFRAKWSVLNLSGNVSFNIFNLFFSSGPYSFFSDIQVFLKNCGFAKLKKPISNAEKSSLKEKLLCSTVGITENEFETTDFYKLSWVSCSTLLEKREVYMEKG